MNPTIEIISHPYDGDPLASFLNVQLRANVGFSICDEYPAVFGDYPSGHSLVAKVNGLMAGHVGLVAREFIGPGFRLKVGLIGSVVTAPEFRNRGIATALLSRATLELRSRGCLISCLWSDETEFYQKLGYHRAGREIDFRFDSTTIPSDAAPPVLFDEKVHTRLVWRLYLKHALRIDRSLEEQRRLVRIPRAKIFLTVNKSEVTSYLAVHKGMDFTDTIHEWGGDPLELQRNIAGVQKHHFPAKSLTLIAPTSYDVSFIRAIATQEAKGVLGLIQVLEKTLLLQVYSNYLRGLDVPHRLKANRCVFGKDEYQLETPRDIIRLVYGHEVEPKHPVLPFFLWGFDSI